MNQNKRACIQCNVPMVKATVQYKGMEFEAGQCPKCKDRILTKDLVSKAIIQLETSQ